MQRQTKMINIPINMEEQLLHYLAYLKLNESKIDEGVEESKIEMGEVIGITEHLVDRTGFVFNFEDKNHQSKWVRDSETDLEMLINDYLVKLNIDTVYLFCRVSTGNQVGENHVSLDAQEAELREAALIKYPHIQRIKSVKVVSSVYRKLPKQLKIIGDAIVEDSVLMVTRIDRLSRNLDVYKDFFNDLDKNGVRIYSLAEDWEYNNKKVDFQIGVLTAQKESQLIGERVQKSIKFRTNRGDQIGMLPYGWKCEIINGKKIKVVNEKEQNIIKIIKDTYTHPKKVACWLNTNNIMKKNKKWTASMVSRVRKSI
jgi:DNA invertase Pin-like site-specific DNA recombinase